MYFFPTRYKSHNIDLQNAVHPYQPMICLPTLPTKKKSLCQFIIIRSTFFPTVLILLVTFSSGPQHRINNKFFPDLTEYKYCALNWHQFNQINANLNLHQQNIGTTGQPVFHR